MQPAPLYGDHPVIEFATCEFLKINPLVKLRVAKWIGGARGTVHIFNGRTEYIEKYYDVISEFIERGFIVTAHDWRGQGLSTRNNVHPKRCHIDDFDQHQSDARAVMKHFADLPGPHFLFCHSMGGAIGTRYLAENKGIAAAMMSAPMLGISVSKTLSSLRPLLLKAADKFGYMWSTAPGTREKNYESYARFKGNLLTSNKTEWDKMSRNAKNWPDLNCGGPTMFWVKAAFEEMAELSELPAIPVPTILFMGTDENVVSQDAIRKRISIQDNWRLIEFDGGRHESYLEKPAIKEKMWLHIDMFIDQFDQAKQ